MRDLLFEKSAFQGLGDNTHALIRSAYSTITASTLLHEIGGDLAVERQFKAKTPEGQAAMLARKFGDRVETHRDWKYLCQQFLLGVDVVSAGPTIYDAVDSPILACLGSCVPPRALA